MVTSNVNAFFSEQTVCILSIFSIGFYYPPLVVTDKGYQPSVVTCLTMSTTLHSVE